MSGRRLFACRLLPILPLLLGREQSQAEKSKLEVYSGGATLSMFDDDEFSDVIPEETLVEIEEEQDACVGDLFGCGGDSPATPSPTTAPTGQQATDDDLRMEIPVELEPVPRIKELAETDEQKHHVSGGSRSGDSSSVTNSGDDESASSGSGASGGSGSSSVTGKQGHAHEQHEHDEQHSGRNKHGHKHHGHKHHVRGGSRSGDSSSVTNSGHDESASSGSGASGGSGSSSVTGKQGHAHEQHEHGEQHSGRNKHGRNKHGHKHHGHKHHGHKHHGHKHHVSGGSRSGDSGGGGSGSGGSHAHADATSKDAQVSKSKKTRPDCDEDEEGESRPRACGCWCPTGEFNFYRPCTPDDSNPCSGSDILGPYQLDCEGPDENDMDQECRQTDNGWKCACPRHQKREVDYDACLDEMPESYLGCSWQF